VRATSAHTNTHAAEFLDAIRSVNPPGKWKIVVVDEHSQALLNHVLKQFDILEENVTRASRRPRRPRMLSLTPGDQ
jgi:hypothetical protein